MSAEARLGWAIIHERQKPKEKKKSAQRRNIKGDTKMSKSLGHIFFIICIIVSIICLVGGILIEFKFYTADDISIWAKILYFFRKG